MLAHAVGAEAGKWMRELIKKEDGPIIINIFGIYYNVHFCPKVQAAIISIKPKKKKKHTTHNGR